MIASLLLLAGLTTEATSGKVILHARTVLLPTEATHLRIAGGRLFISGFHSGKLVMMPAGGREPAKELRLDAYEAYRPDPAGGEIREVRRAAGGDLVLAGGKIFVAQVFQGSLLVVDQATFTPVKRLPLGGEGCLAASSDGKTVFFASNTRAEFHVIDTRTYGHRTVAYPPGGHGIGCLAVSPDGRRLYLGIQRGGKMRDGTQLSGGNCFLAVYDLAKQGYAGTVFLARKRPDGSGDDGLPTSFAFSPDGKRLYIGTSQCEAGVLVVDTQELRPLENLYFGSQEQVPAFPWVDPIGVAVYGRWLLVAVRHNRELAVVDLDSHQLLARISHDPAVDLQGVVVRGRRVYLCGGSAVLTVVEGADLSKLLSAADVKRTGPVQVTLVNR
jgi:hypothetical protein